LLKIDAIKNAINNYQIIMLKYIDKNF